MMTDEQMLKLLEKDNWEYVPNSNVYDGELQNGDWNVRLYSVAGGMKPTNMLSVYHKNFDGVLHNCYDSKMVDKFLAMKKRLVEERARMRIEKIQKFVTENL